MIINFESFSSPYPVTILTEEQSLYWSFYTILSKPSVWFCFLVSSVAALAPDLCYKIITNMIVEYKEWKIDDFNKKSKSYRDLPINHEEQKRKRTGKLLKYHSLI